MVMFATAAHSLTVQPHHKTAGLSPHPSGRSSINHGNTQLNSLKLFQINEINPADYSKLGEKSQSMRNLKVKEHGPSRHTSGFSVGSDGGGGNSSTNKQNSDIRSVIPEIKINDEDQDDNYFTIGSEAQKKKLHGEHPVPQTEKKEEINVGAVAKSRNQSVIRMRNVTWFKHTADSSGAGLR